MQVIVDVLNSEFRQKQKGYFCVAADRSKAVISNTIVIFLFVWCKFLL